MAFELKFGVITVCVGNVGDRFLTSGYKERVGLEERLRRIASIEASRGLSSATIRAAKRETPRWFGSCSLPIGCTPLL